MQFFKGLVTGVIGLYLSTYIYKTATHPDATTLDFVAHSFNKAFPTIIVIIFISLGLSLVIWSYFWFQNNSKEIAEDEINRARERAEEIKCDAHTSVAEFRKDNEKTCFKLRMDAESFYAAAKEKNDAIVHKERDLEEHYAKRVAKLESDFAAKISAYIVEIGALVKKNKKLQSDLSNMVRHYKEILAENGLASSAGKYNKRAKKTLVATHYSTPGIENILHGNEPWADAPAQPV